MRETLNLSTDADSITKEKNNNIFIYVYIYLYIFLLGVGGNFLYGSCWKKWERLLYCDGGGKNKLKQS